VGSATVGSAESVISISAGWVCGVPFGIGGAATVGEGRGADMRVGAEVGTDSVGVGAVSTCSVVSAGVASTGSTIVDCSLSISNF